uniref:Ferritin n=1 Tax=Varanus komodoensis TaxID=61221 RepID=A0A8D2LVS8_VARKO
MASQVHQNFHAECEAAVNHLVSLELHASFVYLSMVSWCDLCHGVKPLWLACECKLSSPLHICSVLRLQSWMLT